MSALLWVKVEKCHQFFKTRFFFRILIGPPLCWRTSNLQLIHVSPRHPATLKNLGSRIQVTRAWGGKYRGGIVTWYCKLWSRYRRPWFQDSYCWWFWNPAPVEVGSFSHHLTGFHTSQVVSRISEPSTSSTSHLREVRNIITQECWLLMFSPFIHHKNQTKLQQNLTCQGWKADGWLLLQDLFECWTSFTGMVATAHLNNTSTTNQQQTTNKYKQQTTNNIPAAKFLRSINPPFLAVVHAGDGSR